MASPFPSQFQTENMADYEDADDFDGDDYQEVDEPDEMEEIEEGKFDGQSRHRSNYNVH